MRPTWKAETIVEPFANVSGSTSVWWFVTADAAHVACVNGSVLMVVVAAPAVAGRTRAVTTATLRVAIFMRANVPSAAAIDIWRYGHIISGVARAATTTD